MQYRRQIGNIYRVDRQDEPQEMERNYTTAKHVAWFSCAWLLLSFFPYHVGHPVHPLCTVCTFLQHILICDLCMAGGAQRDGRVLSHSARQGLQHPGPHRVRHRVRVHLRDQGSRNYLLSFSFSTLTEPCVNIFRSSVKL